MGKTNAGLSKAMQKKLQTQNMIITALIIVIAVLIIVSGTAAWYIRTKSDSADIILSNPVNIYITEFEELKDAAGNVVVDKDDNPILQHSLKTDILEQYNTKIYPGDKIKLKLGMQIGNDTVESSPAYVRVKLTITYENIYNNQVTGLEQLASSNLIKYKDAPNAEYWHIVDFNKFKEPQGEEVIEPDYWFVLKNTLPDGTVVSREAQNLETFEFLNGYIELDKMAITNVHANCKFHINYIVEAIQIPHVPDPIRYEGYGPWWDFVLGDEEDVGLI